MVDFVKLKEDKGEKPQRRFTFKRIIITILIIFIISNIISSITYSLTPKIAIVPITGTILTEQSTSLISGTSISSRDIADTLYSIKEDNSVKAVLLDINSPGGSPVASEEISRAIEDLKLSKPVYALINDVGASGAFWVAVSTDKIYASSMSTVGSIGVTSAGLGFEQFIADYNITYRRLTAGEYKDMGTPFREPTEEENEIIKQLLDEIHINFIQHVAKNRNMTFEEVKQYADGSILLGSKAKDINFIDEIGYYPDVIQELRDITNSPAAIEVSYGPIPTFLETLGIKSLFNIPETKSQILI